MKKLTDRNIKIVLEIRRRNQLVASGLVTLKFDGETEYVFGREKRYADIVLNDDKLSRSHICFTKNQNAIYVEDLASKNGSLLNLRELDRRQHLLSVGDTIRIGDHHIKVKRIEKLPREQEITSFISYKKLESDGATSVGKITNGYGHNVA